MENVMWFIKDDNENILEQVNLPKNAEEQAIDEFAVRLYKRGIEGMFKLGYITASGDIYTNSWYQVFGNPERQKNDAYEKEEQIDF